MAQDQRDETDALAISAIKRSTGASSRRTVALRSYLGLFYLFEHTKYWRAGTLEQPFEQFRQAATLKRVAAITGTFGHEKSTKLFGLTGYFSIRFTIAL